MRTIICVGAGPSLTKEDVIACEIAGFSLMVVNGAFQFAYCPEYHYAADTRWWQRNYAYTQASSHKYSIQRSGRDEGHCEVWQMERGAAEGFNTHWPKLCTGYNSGFQAINLAYLLRFRRVILLGYDMKFGPNGEKHCHPDHPDYNPLDTTVGTWVRAFNKIAPMMKELGLKVVNATRDTDLECFSQVRLEELLEEKTV